MSITVELALYEITQGATALVSGAKRENALALNPEP
jgi:hypothetical protein